MHETVVSSRPDREIRKQIHTQGDYSLVPYEDSRCKLELTNFNFGDESFTYKKIDPHSRIFADGFDGIILIGDADSYLDKDIELIVQQMCCGETSKIFLIYKDSESNVAIELNFNIKLVEITEEQLVSDWGWERLLEASIHHKERGVELVKGKRTADAFRRFSKSLKFLIAIEPVDPKVVDDEKMKEMVDLKVKLYNNLAHCQLHYNEFDAALELCNKALQYDASNIKTLYRRCCAYDGLNLHEEAWEDILKVLEKDPNDKTAQQKAVALRPKVKKIKTDYTNVIRKMFG